jgi:hypothetical protein
MTGYSHPRAFIGATSTDNPLLNTPRQLQQSVGEALSSVLLLHYFLVRDEPEWVDDAPMRLVHRGRVRLKLRSARPMKFSSVGDEFSDED